MPKQIKSKNESMQSIIDIARKEIGYTEQPRNLTKYNDWFYGRTGVSAPWCATFVSWVYAQAGLPFPHLDFWNGFASCYYALRSIAKWGERVSHPMPGDVCFFNFGPHTGPDHVGIYERSYSPTRFVCIEGNTSLYAQNEGVEVMERARKIEGVIFVRPNQLKEKREAV